MMRIMSGVVASALLCAAAWAQPVEKVGGAGEERFEGWTRGAHAGFDFVVTKMGAPPPTLGLFKRRTADLKAATRAALEALGARDIAFSAAHPIQNAVMLDADGDGAALVGAARRGAEDVRFAAIVLYGSLDDTPRESSVHLFVAPSAEYASRGGWVPLSVFWHDFEASAVADKLDELGNSPAGRQAEQVATLTDQWIEYIVDALIGQMRANARALNNTRVMTICQDAYDPGDGLFVCP